MEDDLILDESLSARRAWIEIPIVPTELTTLVKSLSARRAWIEMKVLIFGRASKPPSLSARRAWIEISTTGRGRLACGVALRKESVDRNSTYVIRLPRCQGRSPQGERG